MEFFFLQWNLVCDRENLADVIISAYNIGKMIGCCILPPFADKYGRKPIYIIAHALLSAVNIGSTFSPNYLFYLGSKAVAGFLESVSTKIAFRYYINRYFV